MKKSILMKPELQKLKTYKYVGPNLVYTLTSSQAGWPAERSRRPAATAAFFLNFASVERNNGQTDRRIINRVLGLLSRFLKNKKTKFGIKVDSVRRFRKLKFQVKMI